jgi:hypothetical protein
MSTTPAEQPLNTPEQKPVSEPVRTYAILQETSGEESESWYTFIKYQGNEEALAHLSKQLEEVEWYILDDLSTFDLETEFLVSETTAREMTKVDLNHYSFHRKFDGKLQKVDLGFKESHSNEKKIQKAFNVLGYGKIEDFVDEEDIDPADLVSCSESESSSSESLSSSSSSEEEKSVEEKSKKSGKMPSVVTKKPPKVEIPRFAKAKRRHK